MTPRTALYWPAIILPGLLAGLALAAPPRVPLDDDLSDPNAGGETTVVMKGVEAFSLPVRNATREHRRSFVVGNSLFKENWVASPASVKTRQGLGPLLNSQSCSTCHFKDGRGAPPLTEDEVPVGILVRLSLPGQNPHSGVVPDPRYGDQLNPRAIVGVRDEGDFRVAWEEISGHYPDGTAYTLVKPKIRFSNLAYGDFAPETMFSMRVAPAMIGLGLLEAIPESALLERADPEDRNQDGISGRPNVVWNVAKQASQIGRFGWKANQPTVLQQSASAFNGDMGVTSEIFPQQNCGVRAEDCRKSFALKTTEISTKDLHHVGTYSKLLAVPARRNLNDVQVRAGHSIFNRISCQSCHASTFVTGSDPQFPELSHQKIFPYTDLLLHDMGEELADGRPDFTASGREWRTPPLWGISLIKSVNRHTRYLHDGRARNLEEAILWHGGEAARTRDAFKQLPRTDRESVIKFLEAL